MDESPSTRSQYSWIHARVKLGDYREEGAGIYVLSCRNFSDNHRYEVFRLQKTVITVKMSNDNTTKTAESKDDSSKKYVKTHENKEGEDYGYYFYPERKQEEVKQADSLTSRFKNFVFEDVWGRNRKAWNNLRCRENVRRCYEQNPLVKLMVQALHAHGCPVDLEKQIKCEPCKLKVSGGFDFYANHVVICENNAKWQTMVCNIMVHELLHAFDKCRTTMDFKVPEHHACTEVRAANLFHCPLSSALATAEALPWDYKLKHQACVRHKALMSVMLVRDLSEEEGKKVVNKVFERCYNDLEPVGRRFRKKTLDGERAYSDGILYGYSEG